MGYPNGRKEQKIEVPQVKYFNDLGSWGALRETEVHRLILRLRDARLASSSFSPADAAKTIRQNGHERAFGGEAVLAAWDALTDGWQWPAAPCSTSAGDAVKRATMREHRGGMFWPDSGGKVEAQDFVDKLVSEF